MVIANEVGVSPDDVTDYVNRRGVELSIPEPARTLIKFDEERMMSFLAKICVEFDAAVSGNAEFRKLKPDEVEYMKATVLMDFWLGVSRQVQSIYVNARNQILKGEANLRELRARTWHENWSRKVNRPG